MASSHLVGLSSADVFGFRRDHGKGVRKQKGMGRCRRKGREERGVKGVMYVSGGTDEKLPIASVRCRTLYPKTGVSILWHPRMETSHCFPAPSLLPPSLLPFEQE